MKLPKGVKRKRDWGPSPIIMFLEGITYCFLVDLTFMKFGWGKNDRLLT